MFGPIFFRSSSIKSNKMRRFGTFWEIFKVVAIVAFSALVLRGLVAQPFIVQGSSMEPDFHDGEYLLIEKLGYRFGNPSRGDVIVFEYPNNPSVNYVKRIIGLPGETIRIDDGKVFIGNRLLTEQYLTGNERTVVGSDGGTPYEITLKGDSYFVMGDNRAHSSDSREWGPLDRRFIVGKTALVLFPRDDFSAVASPKY